MDEPSFSPRDVIAVLQRHRVDYVLIGALAAVLHGSPVATEDADICPDRRADNLDHLAAALRDMNARVRAPDSSDGFSFACDPEVLKDADEWNLVTDYGQLGISFVPSGTRGYEDLRRDAIEIDIGGGVKAITASLIDIIRSEEAAGGESRARLPLLREMLDRFGEHP